MNTLLPLRTHFPYFKISRFRGILNHVAMTYNHRTYSEARRVVYLPVMQLMTLFRVNATIVGRSLFKHGTSHDGFLESVPGPSIAFVHEEL